ncbi:MULTISPECIES: hypothetical protein [Sphingomonas]|uniref:hypothetical protein n=1 Tax=Sphingomonas TaxID=13687 RepID=UPI001269E65A|nr:MULTISPECIES: hypothetical protein [Sphingomonas]
MGDVSRKSVAVKRRKFAREVGSVVLGVLIALLIGEVADWVRWQIRLRDGLQAMSGELSGNRFNFVERRLEQKCIESRLISIGKVLDRARQTGSLPAIGTIGFPAVRPSESTAFEVAKSEGLPLHMDRQRARDLAMLYVQMDAYNSAVSSEQNSWKTLQLLSGSERKVSDDFLIVLLQAWANASREGVVTGVLAQQGDDNFKRFGVTADFGEFHDLAGLAKKVSERQSCQPL